MVSRGRDFVCVGDNKGLKFGILFFEGEFVEFGVSKMGNKFVSFFLKLWFFLFGDDDGGNFKEC